MKFKIHFIKKCEMEIHCIRFRNLFLKVNLSTKISSDLLMCEDYPASLQTFGGSICGSCLCIK
jgi:hypothetical protein